MIPATTSRPGYLSEIKNAENITKGFLLGTIHLADLDIIGKVNSIVSDFEQISHFALEINTAKLDKDKIDATKSHRETKGREVIIDCLKKFSKTQIQNFRELLESTINDYDCAYIRTRNSSYKYLIERLESTQKLIKQLSVAGEKAAIEVFLSEEEKIKKSIENLDAAISAQLLENSKNRLKLFPRDEDFIIQYLFAITNSITITDGFIYPLDSELAAYFEKRNVEIVEIEDSEKHMEVLNDVVTSTEINALLETTNKIDLLNKLRVRNEQAKNLKSAWLTSDDKKCLSAIETDSELFGELVFQDRSVLQADKINELLKQNKLTLCAVGILHLPGEKGVIALLQQKGWSIKPFIPTKS